MRRQGRRLTTKETGSRKKENWFGVNVFQRPKKARVPPTCPTDHPACCTQFCAPSSVVVSLSMRRVHCVHVYTRACALCRPRRPHALVQKKLKHQSRAHSRRALAPCCPILCNVTVSSLYAGADNENSRQTTLSTRRFCPHMTTGATDKSRACRWWACHKSTFSPHNTK